MSEKPTIEDLYRLQEQSMTMFAEVVQDYCQRRDRMAQLEQECDQLKNERDLYKAKYEESLRSFKLFADTFYVTEEYEQWKAGQ